MSNNFLVTGVEDMNVLRSLPCSVMKLPCRTFLNMPTERIGPEILLCRSDLLPNDLVHNYVMSKEKFLELYKTECPLYVVKDHLTGLKTLLKLLAVIPFEIKTGELLPIPFVVDTGAPGTMYLGRKLRKTLDELNVFQEVASFLGPYKVCGTFTWKNLTLTDPVVNLLPRVHEIDDDDFRANLLGLDAIAKLKLLEPIIDLPEASHSAN